MSQNQLQSLHRRQYDLNSQELSKRRQEAYKEILDSQVAMKDNQDRLLQHRRVFSNHNGPISHSPVEDIMSPRHQNSGKWANDFRGSLQNAGKNTLVLR